MNDQAFLPPRDGDDASYAWLDEWLCEYVDGTMDPSLRAVFETYVEANPDLKAHIEQLNETRDLLGQRGTPSPPSPEKRRRVCNRVRSRVCRKVECDMLRQQASVADLIRDHSGAALGVASSLVVALVVGIFTGALLFGPQSPLSGSPLAATPAVTSDGSSSAPSSSAPSSSAAVTFATSSPAPYAFAPISVSMDAQTPVQTASTWQTATEQSTTGQSTTERTGDVLHTKQAAAMSRGSAYDSGRLDASMWGGTAVSGHAVIGSAGSGGDMNDGDLQMTPWPGGTATPAASGWSLVLTGPVAPFLTGRLGTVPGTERRRADTSPVLSSRRH